MEFVYSDGTWNPETHEYEGGGWTHEPDANKITITSRINIEIGVGFSISRRAVLLILVAALQMKTASLKRKPCPEATPSHKAVLYILFYPDIHQ